MSPARDPRHRYGDEALAGIRLASRLSWADGLEPQRDRRAPGATRTTHRWRLRRVNLIKRQRDQRESKRSLTRVQERASAPCSCPSMPAWGAEKPSERSLELAQREARPSLGSDRGPELAAGRDVTVPSASVPGMTAIAGPCREPCPQLSSLDLERFPAGILDSFV